LRGDADRLDALLADDFLSIGGQVYQLGKREWLDRHRDCRSLSLEAHRVGRTALWPNCDRAKGRAQLHPGSARGWTWPFG
jgi:hypothetical protein